MPNLWQQPGLIAMTLAFVVIGRLAVSYALLPLIGFGKGIGNRNWYHVVAISGMRGALSLALVLALPDSMANRDEIIDAVSGVVVITLIAQGLAIGPLLLRLPLWTPNP
jgi:CPA1 family monovalent cation:H+ antiporter